MIAELKRSRVQNKENGHREARPMSKIELKELLAGIKDKTLLEEWQTVVDKLGPAEERSLDRGVCSLRLVHLKIGEVIKFSDQERAVFKALTRDISNRFEETRKKVCNGKTVADWGLLFIFFAIRREFKKNYGDLYSRDDEYSRLERQERLWSNVQQTMGVSHLIEYFSTESSETSGGEVGDNPATRIKKASQTCDSFGLNGSRLGDVYRLRYEKKEFESLSAWTLEVVRERCQACRFKFRTFEQVEPDLWPERIVQVILFIGSTLNPDVLREFGRTWDERWKAEIDYYTFCTLGIKPCAMLWSKHPEAENLRELYEIALREIH